MRDQDLGELRIGESVSTESGLVLERRSFLTTSAAAFVAAGLPGMSRAARLDARRDEFTFEDFLKEAVPAAKALVGDATRAGQDRYLLALASIAVRLGDVAAPEMRSTGPGKWLGVNEGGDPFTVLHWKLEPGAVVGVHPHIYGNVVTFGLEGAARITNYEVLGSRDFTTKDAFVVRCTVAQWLTAGATNLVNLERNYMHGFVAGPSGARGLDITTRLLAKHPNTTLELGKVLDAAADTFEARWKFE